jgi:hypothetical protein
MGYTAADVIAAAKPLLVDRSEQVFDDELILLALALANRDLATAIRAGGIPAYRKTSDELTVPSGTTAVGRATTPPLPADFQRPIEVTERVSGEGYYKRMSQSDWRMDHRPATALNQQWQWRGDEIVLPGASGDTQIRIEYEADVPDILAAEDVVFLSDSLDALAYATCAILVRERGQDDLSAWFQQMSDKCVGGIIAAEYGLHGAADGRWGDEDQTDAQSVQSVLRHLSALVAPNDPQQRRLRDEELLEFVRMAYSDAIRYLRNGDTKFFTKIAIMTPITAGTTLIDASSTPPLPSDILYPRQMRERKVDTVPWKHVQPILHSFVNPALGDPRYIGYHLWAAQSLTFPASTNDIELQIEYEYKPGALLTPQSPIGIPDGGTALAYLAAAGVALRRQADPSPFLSRAYFELDQLIKAQAKAREPNAGQWGPEPNVS